MITTIKYRCGHIRLRVLPDSCSQSKLAHYRGRQTRIKCANCRAVEEGQQDLFPGAWALTPQQRVRHLRRQKVLF